MARIKIFNIATDKHLEDFKAGKIITQVAAAKRMRMGSTTLLLLRTPGAVEYDPTFPMPIKLGKALGYYIKDIDKYIKNAKKASTNLQFFLNKSNAPETVQNDLFSAQTKAATLSSETDFIIAQLHEMNAAMYQLSLSIDPKTFSSFFKAKSFHYQSAVIPEVKDIVGQYRVSKNQLHIRTKMIERVEALLGVSKIRLQQKSEIVISGVKQTTLSQVKAGVFIGVSGTTIANKLNPNHGSYDPTFPKPIKEEKGRKTFLKRDIQDWLDKQREEHV